MRRQSDERGLREKSAAELWPPLARFVEGEARLGPWASQNPARRFVYEFIRFGIKQAWACLFGGVMVALVLATRFFYPAHAPLARYDFLFLAALGVQAALILLRFESLKEAGVIFLFHLIGTAMEIFKTAHGSWVYPEAAFFRIGGVPLFTGFMYACVGSYMMRAWALFDFRFHQHPPLWQVGALALAIYVNFFTHHYVADMRLVLFAASVAIFWRTTIYYRIHHGWRTMPLLLAAFLAACFIWLAENIATYSHVWLYPDQFAAWKPVGVGKLGSWFLLQIVSYALVAIACRPREPDDAPIAESRARHADRLMFRSRASG
ncbi:DUF817 domain-containing protein [Methylocystis sp. MJC1]|jgi:uncharacterized membrane protein YoaT (DUF817 family)|uniref:DUF817 domain-containing protein n=1 Tax=Methylocystis sp. MJC1 TaxID=2654282 RepID=UPI0013EA6955|nr:DUF817 domain-containing protein [Methylocystis sp. MJC1]KAF2992151.1 hypothetical protein MJC1_00523 [Methylocystis sp. MJC1]MBU6527292.1 DUF817 domain-containing protein [Methylocystis sp. MJC1]UZX10246.1 DUF817 domain-containing protein [Methylocystis sp. MJC1]